MSDPAPDRLAAILDFLGRAQTLKDTMRSGRTHGGQSESVASHSWSLCLLALLIERDAPPLDMEKLLKLCVVHDLGEAISGDIPAPLQDPTADKSVQERQDFHTLTENLPNDLREILHALWDEYAAAESREARFAKGLDKIETMLQHVNGAQIAEFDYLWNLTYARSHTDKEPILRALRDDVDGRTQSAADRGNQDILPS